MDEVDRGIHWLFNYRASLLEEGAEALLDRGSWVYESGAGTLRATFDRASKELMIDVVDVHGNIRSEGYVPFVDTMAGSVSLELQLAGSLTDLLELDDPGWLASLPDPHRIPDEAMVKIVPWHRIADDLFRTTGKRLNLRFSREVSDWWDVELDLDDEPNGSFGQYFPSDPEEFVVALADYLCESYLSVEVWGGWPICPEHKSHPLDPRLDKAKVAVWCCPKGTARQTIGHLQATE